MGQIRTGKLIATGSAVNIDLGFIPAYARFFNANVGAGEVGILEYFNLMGDSQEIWHYCINDQGTAVAASIVKKASGGYLAEYDSTSVGKQMICTFDDTGGAAVDLITCSNVQQVPSRGDVIKFVESGGLPTNLDELTNYYAIDIEKYGTGTFRISTTAPGRGTQSAVDFGSDGTPTNYFINVSKSEPNVSGGKGLTLGASFASDSDVIFFVAMEADRDVDFGDAANF